MTTRTQTYFILMALTGIQITIMNSVGKHSELVPVMQAWLVMAIISTFVDIFTTK